MTLKDTTPSNPTILVVRRQVHPIQYSVTEHTSHSLRLCRHILLAAYPSTYTRTVKKQAHVSWISIYFFHNVTVTYIKHNSQSNTRDSILYSSCPSCNASLNTVCVKVCFVYNMQTALNKTKCTITQPFFGCMLNKRSNAT